MGTNYYRIPTHEEITNRKYQLMDEISDVVLSPYNIVNEFPPSTPWENFTKSLSIHLGKRSGGWKFLWNFHKGKYYENKDELFEFINSGRVVDEYGEIIKNKEFIDMALNWYENGKDFTDESYIDGLRVSDSTEFF